MTKNLGKIKSLKRDRKFRFIQGEDKADYYFKFNQVRDSIENLKEGSFAKFRVKPGIEKSKNAIAMDICIVKKQLIWFYKFCRK